MSKKILILGSKGTLGQALVREFQNAKYEVFAWDREDADVTSESISPKIKKLHPEIIINATAYNAVDKIETEDESRELAFRLNSEAPKKLAEIVREIDAIFVHYSSSYVFSGEKKGGYTETDKPAPINQYGKSKLQGEEGVEKVGGKYYIIRLSRLFGIRGTSEMSKRTFVEVMLAELDKKELEVGDTEVSSLTYAPDLAKLTREIIEAGRPWGIYHGTNEGECTWYGWAKEIFKVLGRGPKVTPAKHSLTPKTTRHPVFSTLLNTKLPKQRSWQEALREFLEKK